jgi:cysteinyl-tRNA synthetase
MNNGLLQFTGDKMSKSVGNVATIRDVLDEYGREAALVFFLGGHWRKPIDFSVQAMEEARAQVEGFRNAFRGEDVAPEEGEWERLVARLEDDFDTPGALAVLHDWRSRRVQELLLRGLEVFGLADLAAADEAPPELVALAQRRQEARARRDFDEADRLRGEIEAAGWEARDEPDGFRLVPRP